MERQWFSNRGQILQIAIAFAALAVGVFVAFPQLPVQQGVQGFVRAWPIIVFPAVAVLLMWLFHSRTHRAIQGLVSNLPNRAESGINSGSTVEKTSNEIAQLTQAGFTVANLQLEDLTVAVGSFQQIDRGLGRIRVTPVALRPLNGNQPGVELKFDTEGGIVHGGKKTIEISVNRFLVGEQSSGHQAEENCIFAFSFSEKHINLFVLRVDAINPNKSEVILSVAHVLLLKTG